MKHVCFKLNLCCFGVSWLLMVAAVSGQERKYPSFERYRVSVSKRTPHHVDLSSHEIARRYRTHFRETAAEGINFAGHYVFTWWGLGTNLGGGGIMDALDGRVSVPKPLDEYGWGMAMYNHVDKFFDFRADSKLLIFYGFAAGRWGTHYFVWNGKTLREVAYDGRTDTGQ